MDKKELYRLIAPYNSKWTSWIKFAPFVNFNLDKDFNLDKTFNSEDSNNTNYNHIVKELKYKSDTAIFIDLPISELLGYTLDFIECGYRPIPLLNATTSKGNLREIIDTSIYSSFIERLGKALKNIKIDENANPVFILDFDRNKSTFRHNQVYDNRWKVRKGDLPSEDFFIQNGVTNFHIVCLDKNKDLFDLLDEYKRINKIVLN